ncbi:hypothetical protein J3E68DRAFT_409434 [Trichoderma sp. SZMC 28012]
MARPGRYNGLYDAAPRRRLCHRKPIQLCLHMGTGHHAWFTGITMLSIALCTSTEPHRKIGFPFCWHVRTSIEHSQVLVPVKTSQLNFARSPCMLFQQGQHHVSVLLTAGPTLVCALWLLSPSPLRANYSVVSKDMHEPCRAARSSLLKNTGRHQNPRSREASVQACTSITWSASSMYEHSTCTTTATEDAITGPSTYR